MTSEANPSPLGHFLARLDELRFTGVPDMGEVGRLLAELAADEDYFAPLIAQMPAEAPNVHAQVTRLSPRPEPADLASRHNV